TRAEAVGARAPALPAGGATVWVWGTWVILPRMPEPRARASGDDGRRVVVVGGGPAGLTAAWALMKARVRAVVLEKDTQFGGHARTVARGGFLFDIGGHRFFTKMPEIERI